MSWGHGRNSAGKPSPSWRAHFFAALGLLLRLTALVRGAELENVVAPVLLKQHRTDALTRRLLGTFPQRIYRMIRIKAVHAFPQLPDLAFQLGLKPGPILALERPQVIDPALEFLDLLG